jgi:hypothetical protein
VYQISLLPAGSDENCNGNCACYVMQLCVEHGSE